MTHEAAAGGSPRDFSLLRYFITASVAALAIVTVAVGAIFAALERDELVRQGERFAQRVAAHIDTRLREDLASAEAPAVYLRRMDPERAARIDSIVRSSIEGFSIRRVYFFDLEGRIVYATAPEKVGVAVDRNPNYDRARGGEVAAEFLDRKSRLDAGGREATPLLETYVPVRDPRGAVVGVIEIYVDAEDLAVELRQTTVRVASTAAASMIVTVGALLLVFLRGDRLIAERAQAAATANAALAELTATLERKVEDRTLKLLAQERLATLGTLAAGIAHEINNPLASISGAAEGLLRRLDRGPVPPEAQAECREYLEIMRDEAFRAKAITRDLLDFARQDSLETAPVHVNDIVRSVAALMRLRAKQRPYDLVLELAPDAAVPRLAGSPSKLRQVVFNVTDNAVEALREDGGRIVWTTGVDEGPEGTGVVLRCRDDGRGIRPEVRAKLFEPFFTTKGPGAGTGLGLAISYRIVASHRGTIDVESEGEGRGTTVTIRLPVAPARADRPGRPAAEREEAVP